MKIINYLFILILFSFYADAQSELLGKSRKEIKKHFKKENIYPKEKNTLLGSVFSDTFHSADSETICCSYDENQLCVEVVRSMKLSLIDSLRNNFNTIYLKRNGETFSSDIWADKGNTFKVHLEIVNIINKVYLDYLLIDKPYVIH